MTETLDFTLRMVLALDLALLLSAGDADKFTDGMIILMLISILQLQIEHRWQERERTRNREETD